MRVVLLGPPGAGKGSLAALLERRLRVPHLSAGEIFRQEIARNTLVGRRVKRYVTGGRLIPDPLVITVMVSRLTDAHAQRGFVLDGFPRTRRQAVGLAQALARKRAPLDGVVYLGAPVSLLIHRLSGRRVCPSCGANYHLRTMRPRRQGQCDRCGTALVVRKDDEPLTIKRRLAVDQKASSPLLTYYERDRVLHRLSGVGPLETVFERTVRLFRRQGWWNGRTQDRSRD